MQNVKFDYSRTYENGRAIIKDLHSEKIIFDGKIESHDKPTQVIGIKIYDKTTFLSIVHVSVNIDLGDELISYKGTIRKNNSATTVNIALYDGKKQNKRAFVRHSVNGVGLIRKISLFGINTSLNPPREVVITNISRGGLTFRAPVGSFKKDSTLDISIVLVGSEFNVKCLIMREIALSKEVSDFGCKFIEIP